MEIRRKLYPRGSSFETTIPRPLLFNINTQDKYDVLFVYDETTHRWYITLQKATEVQK